MLTLINNPMNIDSERKSELNPARAVSLRLLISVDSRSAQLGLFIASNNLLLLRRVRIAVDARCSRRSAHLLLKGADDVNLSSHRTRSGMRSDPGRRRPEFLAGVEELVRASMPTIEHIVDIKHKLPNQMNNVKIKI